ncbi:MAG: hypothetical protein ACRDT6_06715 [Micromonosporaceae bacterium]
MATPTYRSEGAFADALREAIDARGLGLERIRRRLERRGVVLSVATLSYWRSGRSRPGRASSLAAVRELEGVLRVPQGALAALLEPPRPRGRWARTERQSPGYAELCGDPYGSQVERFVNGGNDHLGVLSVHNRFEIGPDRTERKAWIRQALRAERDGPDRVVTFYRTDEPGESLPRYQPLMGCRLGRIRRDPTPGYAMAELLFDHPLRRGETTVLEYEVLHERPYPPATRCYRLFDRPVREYVAEVRFTPPALPARCWTYTQSDAGGQARTLTVDREHRAHLVALSIGPGEYGLRWDW